MKKQMMQASLVALALVVAPEVSATPTPLAPIAAPAARDLDVAIAKARTANPESFRAIAKLRDELPTLGRKARSGKVNVRALLVAQGKAALPAILAELREGPEATPGGWLAPTITSWSVGLLETAGHWGDPIAIPVLEAAALHPRANPEVVAAAVRGLGMLATDEAAKRVEAIFEVQASMRTKIAPAVGSCRRLTTARFLGGRFAGARGAEAVAIAEGLGQVASAWAWKTPELEKRGEGNDVRRGAFEALLGRYEAADPSLRKAIVDALWLVDLPNGPALARGASVTTPASAAVFEALAKQLEKSPLRR
jgi:hypothetical protein